MGIIIENRFCLNPGTNWQGGKTIDEHGYVRIWIKQDDPFYSMVDSSGYILEHRYIMAKHLSHIISEKDTVHHIDGNKTNNEIENLELRKGPHMPGKVCKCGDCNSKNIIAMPLQRIDYSGEDDTQPKYRGNFKLYKDEFKKSWEEGMSNEDIRNKFSISKSTLNRWVKKTGLVLRNIQLVLKITEVGKVKKE